MCSSSTKSKDVTYVHTQANREGNKLTPLNDCKQETSDASNNGVGPKERQYSTTFTMISETLLNNLKRVHNEILNTFPEVDEKNLPTYYLLTKDRPEEQTLLFDPLLLLTDSDDTLDVNNTVP